MSLRDYIKKLCRDYFIIFAAIVICITLLRHFLSPDKYFETKDVFIFMICALAGTLPSLIFYSPGEIPEKEMRFRIILHFVLLEAVLLTLANITGWITGIMSTVILAFEVAAVYLFVRLLKLMDDRKTAGRINEKLKALKDESEAEIEE